MQIIRSAALVAALMPSALMAATPVFAPSGGTYLGGSQWDRAQSVHVDAAGFIYVCGSTRSQNAPVTAGAFDTTHNG